MSLFPPHDTVSVWKVFHANSSSGKWPSDFPSEAEKTTFTLISRSSFRNGRASSSTTGVLLRDSPFCLPFQSRKFSHWEGPFPRPFVSMFCHRLFTRLRILRPTYFNDSMYMYQALHLRFFRPHENHLKSLRGSSSPDDHRIHGSFGLISPPTLQQTSSDPVILMASLN